MTADLAAMQLLTRQHGYARTAQLLELGLSRGQIAHRVRKGLYERVSYGVVAWAARGRTLEEGAMRGVMAAGCGAIAARWTAAALHKLDTPHDHQIHVVAQSYGRHHSPISEVYIHRTRYLPPEHVVEIAGVPATSLSRTIVDCASLLDRWSALRMLDSASASAMAWRNIHTTAERLTNGRSGVRAIIVATAPDGADRFRSLLERLMLEALLQAGMPIGEWNVPLSDPAGRIREVDLCYRDARLVVELDGLRFHRSRLAQQRDRASDRRLQLAGWRVLRFTWDEVVHRPARVADEIGRALGVR